MIKQPGVLAPPTLLEAIGGFRRIAGLAVKLELIKDLMGFRVDEGDVGRVLSGAREHDQVMFGIVAHFIGSGFPADWNRVLR